MSKEIDSKLYVKATCGFNDNYCSSYGVSCVYSGGMAPYGSIFSDGFGWDEWSRSFDYFSPAVKVEKELETPDPEKAQAMRILQKEEDEDTRRDD